MKRFPLVVGVLALIATPILGSDWPQWRGPTRDGVVMKSQLPTKWPEKFPEPKWRSFVGIGYSSPVVSEGKVFIMGREEDKEEVCLSFDAATGKRLWRVNYPSAYRPPDPTAGRGPNSTPTVDKDRVYMLGLGGMFHCLETKSGKILWKHDFAKEYWGVEKDVIGEDAWRPACGASASALVDGDMVILPVGGKKAGALTAFDRKSGKLLWKALDDRSSYASPLIATIAGQRQLIGFTGKRMVGVYPENQELLWEFPFTALYQQTIISPVLWKDHVIISGEAKPTTALAISNDGGKVTQKTAWINADLSAYLTTPIVLKDHLIGFDQRSRRLTCIDLASGKTVWTSPRIGKMFVSLAATNDQIIVLSDSGELSVIEANVKEYKPVGSWKVAEPNTIWSNLAIAGKRIYIKDKEHLVCYEL